MPDVEAPNSDAQEARPGEAGRPATKYDVWAYIVIGLIAIPVAALGIGALVLPPGIAFSLVRRGLSESRTSWTVLGAIVGALWLLLLYGTGSKIMRAGRKPQPPAAPPQ
jgi:hypothetical protein